jgi:pimeloyl-ACP methyl ester carboxylesterase
MGCQDGVSGYRDAIDSLPKYPRASLAEQDTGGHAVVWERPEAFLALARDWMERVEYDLSKRPEI